MRVLANENVPKAAVDELRNRGHDVVWARADMAGAEDEVVLARAQVEQRLVVTLDKDFGELAFRRGLPSQCGVVLFRMTLASPLVVAQRMADAMESRSDWTGSFSVVEDERVRIRPL